MRFLAGSAQQRAGPLPQLIMLGTDMLEKGGLELLLALRAKRDLRHIPVIVLTTSDTAEQRLKTLGVPAGQCVTSLAQLKDLDSLLRPSEGSSTLTLVRLPR